MSKSSKRRKGTAAKSLTLTYSQLEFLSKKPNASEWVRGAIEQAIKIEEGGLTVVNLEEGRGSRIIREGLALQRGAGETAFTQIRYAALDLAAAYQKAQMDEQQSGGDGGKAARALMLPAYQVARDIEKLIKDGQQAAS